MRGGKGGEHSGGCGGRPSSRAQCSKGTGKKWKDSGNGSNDEGAGGGEEGPAETRVVRVTCQTGKVKCTSTVQPPTFQTSSTDGQTIPEI